MILNCGAITIIILVLSMNLMNGMVGGALMAFPHHTPYYGEVTRTSILNLIVVPVGKVLVSMSYIFELAYFFL
jgi:hypothetical protein